MGDLNLPAVVCRPGWPASGRWRPGRPSRRHRPLLQLDHISAPGRAGPGSARRGDPAARCRTTALLVVDDWAIGVDRQSSEAIASADQRLILLSIWASAGFAVLSSVWGIAIGSSMIVFDGLYSFVSIGLSVLAVLALRFTSRGADERFPWGREVAEPLVVVIKAATLGGALHLRRDRRGDGSAWTAGERSRPSRRWSTPWWPRRAVWSSGSCCGGPPGPTATAARSPIWSGPRRPSGWATPCSPPGCWSASWCALGLVAAGRADLAAYVDPGMVVLVSLLFLRVPVKLIIGGMREVLSMSPPADVLDQLASRRDAKSRPATVSPSRSCARRRWGAGWTSRSTSSSARTPEPQTVAECDQVRQDLHDRLADLGYERSVVITFTTDRRWAR